MSTQRPDAHHHDQADHADPDQERGDERDHGHRPTDHLPPDHAAADHDVVVVGGGAAGLAGALSLARARRRVLVVDAGAPRNAPAAAVHNLLTRDGTPPRELLDLGRAEVESFGGEVLDARVVAARRWDRPGTGFVVTLADLEDPPATRVVTARRLLVTTGLVDLLPDVPGLRERWGRDVVHCPFCHGYEVRDRRLVVLGRNPRAGHAGLLWRQWSDQVTLVLEDAAGPLAPVEVERLDARGVALESGTLAEVVVEDDAVSGVRLEDGRVLPADVVVLPAEMEARSDVLTQLGVPTTPLEVDGARLGTRVEAGPTGATPVPGVWAAGNLTDPMAQVVACMAAGAAAGGQLLMDLLVDDADAAVVAARGEVFERPAWEERYGRPDAVFSGQVNAVLAAEAARLAPGRALDVGSGEGGDVVWLAEQGWQATGLEFSSTGRARAAELASSRGVADRVELRDGDVREFDAGAERWDLVTSFFVHLPDGGMQEVTRRLAGAVAPGGTLLVVGHHPRDMPAGRAVHTHTAEQLAPVLDPQEWAVVAETRPRTAPARDGHGETTWHDAVLLARRR
jgi:thioredoxin reductase/predicted O-methyltransferase YrrM